MQKPPCLAALVLASLCLQPATAGGQTPSEPTEASLSRISGHVYRADTHQPLAKVSVMLSPQQQVEGAQRRVARTSADGSFALTDLVPTEYGFEVSRTGFVADRKLTKVLHAGEDARNLVFFLTPSAAVSGVVVDEDDEPVAGLRVLALRPTYLPGGKLQLDSLGLGVTTDDRGEFRIADLAPRAYYFRTGGLIERPMDELPLNQSVDQVLQYGETWSPEIASPDESTPMLVDSSADVSLGRIVVKPEPTWSILGKIEGGPSASGRPLQVFYAKDLPFEYTFGRGSLPIAPDGSFVIGGLSSGDYILTTSASSDAGILENSKDLSVRIIDRNVTVSIPLSATSSVSGKIVLGTIPTPVNPGIGVSVNPVNRQNLYVSKMDLHGSFDVRDVPQGTYTLGLFDSGDQPNTPYPKKISCAGVDYTAKTIALGAGTLLSNCEVTLAYDAGTVSGAVKSGDKRLPETTVVLIPQHGEFRPIPRYTLSAQTDSTGHYSISGIIPGDYYLFAVKSDDEHAWFALSYADLHRSSGTEVSIGSGQVKQVELTYQH